MNSINELGNIEFVDAFLYLHHRMFKLKVASYTIISDHQNVANDYIKNLLKITSPLRGPSLAQLFRDMIKTNYEAFIVEAIKRGLNIDPVFKDNLTKGYIYTEGFIDWATYMRNNPTYVREIWNTDFPGGWDISYADDDVIGFDFPVRAACKLLTEKGYITYWSSANYYDFRDRKGHIVPDKVCGYILIDPANLTEDLKAKLKLSGRCPFWGIAKGRSDNGSYYGIWAEITSPDMLCANLSQDLLTKALALPSITNEFTRSV